METCTVETGLLKKKPCGLPAVTHCVNCEQAICSKHAVAELNDTGRKTGKFLCKLCAIAQKEHDKIAPPAVEAKPATPPPAAKPAEAPKPAAAAAVAKQAPKEAPKQEKKPDDDAPLEFTPSKK